MCYGLENNIINQTIESFICVIHKVEIELFMGNLLFGGRSEENLQTVL